MRVAAQLPERPVLLREVRHRVERGHAREQPWMARQQQQRLLAAHAAAERVDLSRVDPQPGETRRAIAGMRARSAIWPGEPHE